MSDKIYDEWKLARDSIKANISEGKFGLAGMRIAQFYTRAQRAGEDTKSYQRYMEILYRVGLRDANKAKKRGDQTEARRIVDVLLRYAEETGIPTTTGLMELDRELEK